ncbi:MAG: 4-hydroxy-tetrahydrodipicolinate synthase, partial [Deltaproteobacteria bacterium]|nr:4-hydroxy-tetrahydrodipicolinate synthase [Deltaproteobacteria bacterium]
MFEGTYTALITPMRDGKVDLDDLRQLVDYQIAEGITGLVPCGTTGETPTLSAEEQREIIRTVVDQAKGRVLVIAGAGANSTQTAIAQTQAVAELGVDATLQVTPYYNKPSQSGLLAHFSAIADASPLPLVLYNVPGRTGCDMLPATIATLADHPKVAAVKEATGSIARGQTV